MTAWVACSGCWKVRDDKGRWLDIGADGPEYFNPKFTSTGICPECVRRLYPAEIADKVLHRTPDPSERPLS